MEILGEDAFVSGGASIVMVYSFLNVWEVYFAARPCAKPFVGAACSCFSGTGRPFCIVPEDISRLRSFLRDTHRPHRARQDDDGVMECASETKVEGLEADFVGRLMRAAPEAVVMLGLPFGVSNATLRAWVRQGLLSKVVELHLMGHGGPSDAGLANIVTHCPNLRHLTVLCSNITAAASLLLHAQVTGQLGATWWKGVRFSRLCVLPRLQAALQPSLSIQRVPPWLCGEWIPLTPVWGFEVQHYDSLGRFVFLRNGGAERVGVVRSCVPSPFGSWWEIDLCFFARQAWFEQLMLVQAITGPSSREDIPEFSWHAGGVTRNQPIEEDTLVEAPSWVSVALGLEGSRPQGHLGTIRSAVMGSSEDVRHRPRQFPRHGRRVGDWMRRSEQDNIKNIYPWGDRDWAEAALTSSAEGQDATMIFDHAESSEEEELSHMPTMEELLQQLDQDEQPSRRAEEGSVVPSLEEMMTQIDVEEARDHGT